MQNIYTISYTCSVVTKTVFATETKLFRKNALHNDLMTSQTSRI